MGAAEEFAAEPNALGAKGGGRRESDKQKLYDKVREIYLSAGIDEATEPIDFRGLLAAIGEARTRGAIDLRALEAAASGLIGLEEKLKQVTAEIEEEIKRRQEAKVNGSR